MLIVTVGSWSSGYGSERAAEKVQVANGRTKASSTGSDYLSKLSLKYVLLAAIKKGVPENQKLPTLRKYREVLSCERRSKL